MLYNESMHSLIGLLDSSHVFIYRWIIFEKAEIAILLRFSSARTREKNRLPLLIYCTE